MAEIVGFRNSATPSPFRFLYGQRNGELLFPLDLSFSRFGPDVADGAGSFVGTSVLGPGFVIGIIRAYSFPAVGDVIPVVFVTPDPVFNMVDADVLPVAPSIQPPMTSVFADLGGSQVTGTLLAFNAGATYLDAAHTVAAYITQFDVPLHPDHHGAPVRLADGSGTIVGMVTRASVLFGQPNALVSPV